MLDTLLQILQISILAVILLKLLTNFSQRNEAAFRDSRKVQTTETQPIIQSRKIDLTESTVSMQRSCIHIIALLNETLSEKVFELNELLIEKEELTKFLYIQIDDLEARELNEPATVCTAIKCTEAIKVQGETKIYYNTRCHVGCYELDGVGTVNIGNPNMKRCVVLNHTIGNCVKCGCSSEMHRRITVENCIVKQTIVDQNTTKQIKAKEEEIDLVQDYIDKLHSTVAELQKEIEVMQKVFPKFAVFLKFKLLHRSSIFAQLTKLYHLHS